MANDKKNPLSGAFHDPEPPKDAEAAIFLYETEDGAFKVSTRSSNSVDVAKIAVGHGGGGHVRAAGFSMTGNADEIVEGIVAEIAEQLCG